MAAGEDETQPVVFDVFVIFLDGVVGVAVELAGQFAQGGVEAGTAAEGVYGFESAGGDEPGAGVIGDAAAGPLFDGGPEGVVEGVFGQVEIAQDADEGGEDAAGFEAVDGFYLGMDAARPGDQQLFIQQSIVAHAARTRAPGPERKQPRCGVSHHATFAG
jgi:hypothetical protein